MINILQVGIAHFLRLHCQKPMMTDLLQALANFLDRPLFPWKTVLVGFSLGQYVLESFLSFRQYRVLQQTKPPKVLEGEVTQKVFDDSQVSLVDAEHSGEQ
jgi:hypothetical protein